MRFLVALLYFILLVFGVAFAALNTSSVVVDFYFFSMKLPISLVVTLFLGVGIVLGYVVGFTKYLRMKLKVHHLNNQIEALKKLQGSS